MSLPAKKDERCTYADILAWDEDKRAEIINGEVFMVSAPSPRHQEISIRIERQLDNFLEGKRCKFYHAPMDVRLFEKDGDGPEDVDTVVQPDISVVCDSSKIDHLGCKGAPDLVIEVLSPSTRRHDQLVKLNLYQQAGVREYWVVDPANTSIQVFLLEDGRYTIKDFGADKDILRVNVLEGCFIDLAKVFIE